MSNVKKSFWYICTPYTKYERGLAAAWVMACEQTALLIKAGIPVYSPIAHTHPVADFGNIDKSWGVDWLEIDLPMIEAAHGCVVVMAPGWAESHGIELETKMFFNAGKPILWMHPSIIPPELLP